MSETYTPSGNVGTALKRATSGEAATGTHGSEFMRTNPTTIADKIRFLNDAGTISEEAAIAPTLVNSWVDHGGAVTVAGYYKTRDGIVRLQGAIKNGTGTAGTTLFTLPAGYRPGGSIYFVVANDDATALVNITSAGVVQISVTLDNTDRLALDGISFRAA